MSAATPDIGSLLAALGGGQGGPPPDMGGMMGGSQLGPEDQAQGGDPVPDLLQQAIDALHQAFAAETEPIDKEMIAKALTSVQQILAQEQKEKDQAMGGPGVRMIRRNR